MCEQSLTLATQPRIRKASLIVSSSPPVRCVNVQEEICVKPALLTGTSSEFLGRRALPRMIRVRNTVFVMGPDGSGKTSVAERFSRVGVSSRAKTVLLDTRELQRAVLERIRCGSWPTRLVRISSLILDGPVWLQRRPGVVAVLKELLQKRQESACRTVVVQSDADGSLHLLMEEMETGSVVVIGLRFPKGNRGRLRFARKMCDKRGIPREAARGTQNLEPWRYCSVIDHIQEWQANPKN